MDANRRQRGASTLAAVPNADAPNPGGPEADVPGRHRGRIVVTAGGPGSGATIVLSDADDPDLVALAHEVLAAARAAGVDVVLRATPTAR